MPVQLTIIALFCCLISFISCQSVSPAFKIQGEILEPMGEISTSLYGSKAFPLKEGNILLIKDFKVGKDKFVFYDTRFNRSYDLNIKFEPGDEYEQAIQLNNRDDILLFCSNLEKQQTVAYKFNPHTRFLTKVGHQYNFAPVRSLELLQDGKVLIAYRAIEPKFFERLDIYDPKRQTFQAINIERLRLGTLMRDTKEGNTYFFSSTLRGDDSANIIGEYDLKTKKIKRVYKAIGNENNAVKTANVLNGNKIFLTTYGRRLFIFDTLSKSLKPIEYFDDCAFVPEKHPKLRPGEVEIPKAVAPIVIGFKTAPLNDGQVLIWDHIPGLEKENEESCPDVSVYDVLSNKLIPIGKTKFPISTIVPLSSNKGDVLVLSDTRLFKLKKF